jgi:hypothetical protein
VDRGLQAAVKAAVDPRLLDMAGNFARMGRAALKVLKIVG